MIDLPNTSEAKGESLRRKALLGAAVGVLGLAGCSSGGGSGDGHIGRCLRTRPCARSPS